MLIPDIKQAKKNSFLIVEIIFSGYTIPSNER